MPLLRKTLHLLVYSNLFIALCAVALVFTNQLTIGEDLNINSSVLFVFFSTLFTYSYLKSRPAASGKELTAHETWVNEHKQLSKNLLLISLICSVAFFFQLNTAAMLTVAVLAVFTLLYGFLPVPFTSPARKLREFGLLKTIFVALVWSVTTVVIPLSGNDVSADMLVFLLLRRFLFVLALTLTFEIKDLKHDEAYSIQTVPMRWGVGNTKLLAQLLLFGLMGVLTLQYFFYDISLGNMLSVNLSLLVSIFCIQPLDEDTPALWYYTVLDGMMILQFVFVLAAYKLMA